MYGENSSSEAEDEGKYHIPYKTVKEIVFSKLNTKDMVDLPHSARLQYGLLTNEAILSANVEFSKRKITIVYNPKGSGTGKEEISRESVLGLLEKGGIHTGSENMSERNVDYKKEIYNRQFHPITVKEHMPYGYTTEEWGKIKTTQEKRKTKSARSEKK